MATLGASIRVRGGQQSQEAATSPADVTSPTPATVQTLGLSTAQWVWVITAASAGWLLLMYFGHGGSSGSVF